MLSRSILDAYLPLLLPSNEISHLGHGSLAIPKLKREDLVTLLTSMKTVFEKEETLLNIWGDFNVVGDIHGNLKDLIRIFCFAGSPYQNNYIFLGDYVDRGEMSIECIVLLFAYKLAYPNKIYLLRGNHEFELINSYYGFKQQVLSEYDEEIYNMFNEVFSYLPLAAVLNQKYFLVHGGISPSLNTIKQIAQLKRPITSFQEGSESDIITDIMWGDPSTITNLYAPSPRGFGYVFGMDSVIEFLCNNNVKYIVRAHQCVTQGFEENFGGACMTVFSTSNYCTMPPNSSSILQVTEDNHRPTVFAPIKHFRKFEVEFREIEVQDTVPLCNKLKPVSRTNSNKVKNPGKRFNNVQVVFTCKPRRTEEGHGIYSYSSTSELPKLENGPRMLKKSNSQPEKLHLE
ncbi:Ser/Thr protein phosphatase, putative [Trichomonas vaginalis G3]|uniref:Serine/threonine-protein phosphatase n=1 Tax=Trichomonas vaginalis (strain ATCC PRA-98 / G3) TaxID=412133 RepID=A2DKW6_TRIV3|nr:phosphoprotein phosphatase protein [Trichomonas vaginalis G3]EAY18919.1 Ser/Thr protein phosphatase, putative [Trichomonas vaginalis G3]KAI5531980.1 phosphoprotein phosphatase protein [Trichomonas vaginalis G3]|eukprot:XP_001579905.1 Ser/Thr protein phosphatase [Trichomonas vaginalis G3]